jgi:uncharacterized protein
MFDDLLDACRRDDLERVQALVAADPTLLTRHAATGETPLLAALYHRNMAVVEWLRGQSWTRSLFEAAAIDDVAAVERCLDEGRGTADTYSSDGWTPLHLAAFFAAPQTVELLIARGASLNPLSRNAMANTPLHAALAAKCLPAVSALLDAGADPAVVCSGYSPLAIAEGNHFEAGAELVRAALDTRRSA